MGADADIEELSVVILPHRCNAMERIQGLPEGKRSWGSSRSIFSNRECVVQVLPVLRGFRMWPVPGEPAGE